MLYYIILRTILSSVSLLRARGTLVALLYKLSNFVNKHTFSVPSLPSMTNYRAAVSAHGTEVFLLIFSNQLIYGGETDGCYGTLFLRVISPQIAATCAALTHILIISKRITASPKYGLWNMSSLLVPATCTHEQID